MSEGNLEIKKENILKAMENCPDAKRVLKILFPNIEDEKKELSVDDFTFKRTNCVESVVHCEGIAVRWRSVWLVHFGDNGYIRFYKSIPSSDGIWQTDSTGRLVIRESENAMKL